MQSTGQRWTILARVARARRRPSQPDLRERVRCRCVCGIERIVWLEDVTAGRSTGCSSRTCRARFAASAGVRDMLSRWATGELEALEGMASRQRKVEDQRRIQRLARAQYQSRMTAIDQHIAELLKAPPLEDQYDACEGL